MDACDITFGVRNIATASIQTEISKYLRGQLVILNEINKKLDLLRKYQIQNVLDLVVLYSRFKTNEARKQYIFELTINI